MSIVNKSIAAQSKTILDKFGYEVKLSHLYEMFSQLAGEKDWNTAKAKNTQFENLLKKDVDVSDNKIELFDLLNNSINFLTLEKPCDFSISSQKLNIIVETIVKNEKIEDPKFYKLASKTILEKLNQFYLQDEDSQFKKFPEFEKYKDLLKIDLNDRIPSPKKMNLVMAVLEVMLSSQSNLIDGFKVFDYDEVSQIVYETYRKNKGKPQLSDLLKTAGELLKPQDEKSAELVDRFKMKIRNWTAQGVYRMFDGPTTFDFTRYAKENPSFDLNPLNNFHLQIIYKTILQGYIDKRTKLL
jgi:hypothetical protein